MPVAIVNKLIKRIEDLEIAFAKVETKLEINNYVTIAIFVAIATKLIWEFFRR